MRQKFAGFKARDYEFRNDDGTTDRHVIVIYAGNIRVGFIEYDNVHRFIDRMQSLCAEHDERQKGQATNEGSTPSADQRDSSHLVRQTTQDT